MGRPKQEWNLERAQRQFMSHVNKGGPNECWPWTGAICAGYGAVNYKGKQMRAHRAAYLLFVGPITQGLDARHTCDNRPCVNWESHIIPGTRRQNIQDMIERGRRHDTAGSGHGRTHLTDNQVIRILMAEPTEGYRRRLAEEFGISVMNVHQIRNGNTWKHLRPDIPRVSERRSRPGASNPWAKLTDEEVVDIFTHHRGYGVIKQLAHKYDVDSSTIQRIRSGDCWQEVTKGLKEGRLIAPPSHPSWALLSR